MPEFADAVTADCDKTFKKEKSRDKQKQETLEIRHIRLLDAIFYAQLPPSRKQKAASNAKESGIKTAWKWLGNIVFANQQSRRNMPDRKRENRWGVSQTEHKNEVGEVRPRRTDEGRLWGSVWGRRRCPALSCRVRCRRSEI